MKVRFDAEIKPGEWLAMAGFLLITILAYTGRIEMAIGVFEQWLTHFKK